MSSISILLLIIMSLGVGYLFSYPMYTDITALMDEKQKQEASLEVINNIEIKKAELLKKFNNISDDSKKNMEIILPNTFDFVRLISHIDSIASPKGITIDKITSKELSSSVGGSIGTAEPEKIYQSAIIGFSFSSTYEKFNELLNDLEKSLRILDIRTLKVMPQENGINNYTVEFETYWLR